MLYVMKDPKPISPANFFEAGSITPSFKALAQIVFEISSAQDFVISFFTRGITDKNQISFFFFFFFKLIG